VVSFEEPERIFLVFFFASFAGHSGWRQHVLSFFLHNNLMLPLNNERKQRGETSVNKTEKNEPMAKHTTNKDVV